MNNKSSLLKVFNTHLLEFIDDVISIFPDNLDLKTGKTFIEGLKKVNPKSLIQVWKSSIVNPYRNFILQGDQAFFLNKDYTNDLPTDSGKALEILDQERTSLKNSSVENKKKAMKYVQNLTKISELYFL